MEPVDYNEEIPDIQPLKKKNDIFLKPISNYNEAPIQLDTCSLKTYFHTDFDPPDLPILTYRQKIIDKVKNNMVSIITAPTGSGKSTQVPQYIMDDEYFVEKRHFKIVVTQPRRVAAMSLANRVLSERNLPPLEHTVLSQGTLVGYQIGMDKKVNEDTRLIYMTTGVLLRKLITMQTLKEFTHIVLDEVHERDKDTDFLLLLIKKMLCKNEQNYRVKIIIMSATVDANKFANYFRTLTETGNVVPSPTIEIKEQMYGVPVFYLDEFKDGLGHSGYNFDTSAEPLLVEKMYHIARDLIKRFDDIERQDQHLADDEDVIDRGSVLVFLPGIYEIETMQSIIRKDKCSETFDIICLHSTIPRENQMKVFNSPRPRYRKIILSTNIAESSITVPDIKYVIDFCITKELHADSGSGMSSLRYNWAPKSSLDQRKGRAGRVSNGRCYRFINKDFVSNLKDFTTPEMQRCSVEQLILWCKILNIGDPEEMLCYALDPPQLDKLRDSAFLLLEVGALVLPKGTIDRPIDQDLTFLGHVMGSMPLDVRITRLVMFGFVFDCLCEAVIMAACLSLPAFLEIPYNDKDQKFRSYVSRMRKAKGTFSDPIMMLNLYNEWYNIYANGSNELARKYCRENFINFNRVNEVASLVQDLLSCLRSMNIPDYVLKERHSEYSGSSDFKYMFSLKLALAAANFPHYYIKDKHALDRDNCIKTFGDKSPSDTIMYTGMQLDAASDAEIERKYHHDLSAFFKDVYDPIKRLRMESNRLYVTFENPQESAVAKSVYYALKTRQIGKTLELRSKQDTNRPVQSSVHIILPKKDCNLYASVTHVESPTKFYCQLRCPVKHRDGIVRDIIRAEFDDMQYDMQQIERRRFPEHVNEKDYGMTTFGDDSEVYRVKAVKVDRNFNVKVYYLDFGNYMWINANMFFLIPHIFLTCPFQAVECALESVAPIPSGNTFTTSTVWDQKLIDDLRARITNKHFTAKVFYMLNGILHIDLFEGEHSLKEHLINGGKVCEGTDDYRTEFARLTVGVGDDKVQLETVVFNKNYTNDSPDFKNQTCKLSGPTSPYTVAYTGMTETALRRSTVVDQNSVNSIVICPNPSDQFSELLTASTVALSGSGCRITLRGTTQHFPIKGLPHIMVLLFAPKLQLHTSVSKLHYIGCVAGIGCDEYGDALWPDHDLQITFDYRLMKSDLDIINKIRLVASNILEADDDDPSKFKYTVEVIKTKQNNIKQYIVRLLNSISKRPPLPPLNRHINYGWDCSHDTLEMIDNYSGEDTDILRPHNLLAMEYDSDVLEIESNQMKHRVTALQRNVYDAEEMTGVHTGTTLNCELCDVTFKKFSGLRNHFSSDDHLLELRRLNYWSDCK